MRLLTLLAALFVLTGCAVKSPWEHYDACASQTSSFPAMVECGKQKRTAYCENDCSSEGNAFVQYADALAMAVKNKEMTEAEALRRFAEFKTGVIGSARRDEAIMAAGAAAGRPKTCTKIGNSVSCY